MTPDRMLRKPAAEYLTRRLGVKVTDAMLAKWATLGTGPAFGIVLGKASYALSALDSWADAQLSEETPASKRRRKVA